MLFISGDYTSAAENFERFYELTKDRSDLELEDGSLMHAASCHHLARIYTTIAEKYEQLEDLQQYQAKLEQAYIKSTEGKWL